MGFTAGDRVLALDGLHKGEVGVVVDGRIEFKGFIRVTFASGETVFKVDKMLVPEYYLMDKGL